MSLQRKIESKDLSLQKSIVVECGKNSGDAPSSRKHFSVAKFVAEVIGRAGT